MDKGFLRTDVDDFIQLVSERGKMSIKDAAKILGVTEKTIEAWTDFLVEEHILETEYKFTTQYVFINNVKSKSEVDTKDEFFKKAKDKKIPPHQAKMLWLKYLTLNEKKIEEEFCKKAKDKGISLEKIDSLWKKYYVYLKSD